MSREKAAVQSKLGVALGRKGDFEGAIREFHEALRLDPDYPAAHNNLAVVLFATGEYKEAGEHVRVTLDLGGSVNPDFIKALEESS